jgi:hypothetical protein
VAEVTLQHPNNEITFQRLIFDEVDHLSITSCRPLRTRFLWLISASYGNIMYPRGFSRWDPTLRQYVWSANGISHSGFIKTMMMDVFCNIPMELSKLIIVKNTDEYVERSMVIPPVMKKVVLCKTPTSIRILHGIAERSIIDCLNANNVQGAISYITPSHKTTEDNIVNILIQKYTKELTNLELRYTHTQEYIFETETEKQNALDRIRAKTKEVQDKIDLIRKRIVESETCIICYDTIQNKTITQCCQNSFCFECITSWITKRKHSCPLCKGNIGVDDMYIVDNVVSDVSNASDTSNADNGMTKGSVTTMSEKWDKNTNLKILLQNREPGSKFLIFSNHDHSFLNIYSILQDLDIRFEHLKGNGNVIRCTVQKYKEGNVDVLLVNSSHYGSGLNLENTSDIIMFHKFDSEIEKQVIGRADRPGRTSSLRVWYLLHENETHQ